MRVLIWGSRNLTWKHLRVMDAIAVHAMLNSHEHAELRGWLPRVLANDEERDWGLPRLPDMESLNLLNGDGPPGRERGAIGADKLALFAAMQRWPEKRRRVKWFPPEPKDGETWPQAAHRRDVEMADARPDRAYVVHSDLDRSKGSIITAKALTERGIGYWYVKASQSGELLGVERR